MKTKQDRECLNPLCGRPRFARGLCFRCYQAARWLIVNKRTTWEELEKKGKSLPRGNKGRHSLISQWFLK